MGSSGEIGEAYVYYSQASALQPRNKTYRNHAAALKLRGAVAGDEIPGHIVTMRPNLLLLLALAATPAAAQQPRALTTDDYALADTTP